MSKTNAKTTRESINAAVKTNNLHHLLSQHQNGNNGSSIDNSTNQTYNHKHINADAKYPPYITPTQNRQVIFVLDNKDKHPCHNTEYAKPKLKGSVFTEGEKDNVPHPQSRAETTIPLVIVQNLTKLIQDERECKDNAEN